MTLVIDASVASKWVLPEDGAELASRLRERGEDLIAPSLIVSEIGNAIWKRVIWGELSSRDAAAALGSAVNVVTRLIPLEELAPSALAIAAELKHPIYDCFYVALAERERAALVTADKRLLALAKKTKFRDVVTPL
jgi:predicted nucleic acid-binding protein